MLRSKPPRAAVIAAALGLVAAVYVLRLDRVAGLFVDDAWYVLLAHSLAEGRGFRLISSAAVELLPVVPPGFPAVLALVLRIHPDVASSILWLKAVSVVSMIGASAATAWYFARWRAVPWPMALAIAVATALTPAFVFLATSTVMAECVFMLGQITPLILIERSVCTRGDSWWRITALAAVVAAATTLVRSTGFALLAAAVLYLLTRRLWRHAALFAIVAIACLLPWNVYARLHAPTEAQRVEHGGSIVYPYLDSMRLRIAGDRRSGVATFGDLARRLAANGMTVLGKDVGGIVLPAMLRGPDESGEEVVSIGSVGELAGSMGNAPATIVVSLLFSALIVLGWASAVRRDCSGAEFLVPLSLLMAAAVPYQTFRYVLTSAPFLFFYLVTGAGAVAAFLARRRGRPFADPARVARIVLLCVIGVSLLDHLQYVFIGYSASSSAERLDWIADSREVDDVIGWMNAHLHDPGAVATTNPGLVYLRTGRHTVALDDLTERWRIWKAHGIRYLVCLRPAEPPDPSVVHYRLLYQTSRHRLWVVEL
jgi:hypothetical protein